MGTEAGASVDLGNYESGKTVKGTSWGHIGGAVPASGQGPGVSEKAFHERW